MYKAITQNRLLGGLILLVNILVVFLFICLVNAMLALGATVDPVSHTIKAYDILNDKENTVLPGMSGTATFISVGS